jgi:hypothetical protein
MKMVGRLGFIAFICAALAVFGGGVDVPHFRIVQPALAQNGGTCSPLMGVMSCPSGGGSFSMTYQSTSANNTVGTTIDYGTMSYSSGCTRIVTAIVTNFYASSAIAVTGVTVNGVSSSQVSGAYGQYSNILLSDIWETRRGNGPCSERAIDVAVLR